MRKVIMLVTLAMVAIGLVAPNAAGQAKTARAPARSAAGTEPNPTVTGPITGGIHGRPFLSPVFNVADYGYSEKEYFFGGTAVAYGATDTAAAYESRMLVFEPTNQKRFSGTVNVEWDNVTAQADAPADFEWLQPQIFANGDAYVAVSAQQAGVCGLGLTGVPVGGVAPVCTPTSLKGFDPVRYAPLFHPGDDYAYDIFSQAMQAILHPSGIAPLGKLKARTLLAIGESQSAFELDSYLVNGADAAAQLADGFLIDSDLNHAEPTVFRVPTIYIWGEDSVQDVATTSGPDHVAWSISGAAHTDYWLLQHLVGSLAASVLNTPDISRAQETQLQDQEGNYAQEGPSASTTCAGGEEFPRRYVLDAAQGDLAQWVQTGTPAPSVPPIDFNPLSPPPSSTTDNVGVIFDTDAQGNALGGLREPWITVPVATYIGNACPLLGTSTPLLPTVLSGLYPTHADYVKQMISATVGAVQARFLTDRDAIDLLTRACDSAIPSWGTTPTSAQPSACHHLGRVVTSIAAG